MSRPPQLVLSPVSLVFSVEAATWECFCAVPQGPAPLEQHSGALWRRPRRAQGGLRLLLQGRAGLTSQLSPWGFSQPLPGGSQAGLTSQPTLRGWGFVMVWAGCSLSAGAGGRGLAVCRVGTQVQPPEGVWLGLLLVAGGGGWVGGGLTVRSRGLFAVHPEGWFY